MAEKINVIVTEEALKDLAKAIQQVKELETFINKASTPSASNNYTDSLKKQSAEIKTLTEKIAELELAKKKITAIDTQEIADNRRLNKEINSAAMANSSLAKSYEKLTYSRTQAKNKLQDLIASEKASNAEIRKAQKEFDVLNKKVAAADKAVGRFSDANRKINGLASSVGNLMTAFGVGTGIALAAGIVKDIYTTTKALQSMDLALKLVSDTQEKYASNTAFITVISEKWGLEIKSTTEQFTKFYADAKGKLSESEIKETFEGIAKAGSVMGLSIEKQQSAFTAFQQMLSKGTIQAQELKLQLGDALPGSIKVATAAYQKLHPELKVTEALLYKHMEQGKLISSEMIPEMVKGYQKLYGIENVNGIDTLTSAQNRLQNSWTELIRSMNESETGGISSFFSFFIKRANEMLNLLTRANTSWDELYNKAERGGRQKGISIAEKRFEEGGSSESGANASINTATKEYLRLQKELNKVQKEGQALTDKIKKRHLIVDIADLAFQIDGDQERLIKLKEQKEILLSNLNIQAAIINKTKLLKASIGQEKVGASPTEETEEQRKEREKAEKDRLQDTKDASEKKYKIKLSNLEREKELIKDLRDDKETSIEDMLFLDQAFAYKEIAIAQLNYDYQKSDLNKFHTEKENAISESQDRQLKATENFNKEQLEKTKEWYKKNPPLFIESEEQKTAREKSDKDKLDALKAQEQAFRKFAGDFADSMGFSDTFDFLLDEKDGKTLFDRLKDGEAKWNDYALAITTVMQDAYNFISEQSKIRFDNEYTRLEEQKELAIKNAGDSASAKEQIELEYEKKRKEIATREAKAKKKQAMFNIALDTAQAVMASWAKSGFPWMSIAAAAMGAIQIAMVASQKIPEYWQGTENAQEGFALTQERGAEIITDKKGNIKDFGDSKGARLTKMQSGDKVFTATETKQMMFNRELNSMMFANGIGSNTAIHSGISKDDLDEVIGRHLGNKTTQSINFDKNGFSAYVSKNGNITRRNEDRGSGSGITF